MLVPPRLDHLGIAVKDLDAACRLYAGLGFAVVAREVVAHELVEVAMLPMEGGTRIELLQPTAPESAVARFLEKRGEGLHHLAMQVRDLAVVLARLKAEGVRLVKDEIQTGAGGHRYVFVHPASAGGVLIELVEAGTHG